LKSCILFGKRNGGGKEPVIGENTEPRHQWGWFSGRCGAKLSKTEKSILTQKQRQNALPELGGGKNRWGQLKRNH